MRPLSIAALALVATAYSSSAYAAGNWADFATVSATMGIQSGRLCIGDGPAGDVGCPSYAPSVNTAGDVIVPGTVNATGFVGDGSGLTNINASSVSGLSADRITSGTMEIVANGTTSMISITTAGVTTGYFTGAGLLILPGISVTTANGISSTRAYFSDTVTVGGTSGLGAAGLAAYGLGVKGNILISNTAFSILSWSGGSTSNGRLWDAYTDGGQFYMRAVDDGYTSSSQFLVASRGTGANSASITQVIFPNGNIGIGTSAPSTTLTVVANTAGGGIRITGVSGSVTPALALYLDGTQHGTFSVAAKASEGIASADAGDVVLKNVQARNLILATSNTERVRILPDGSVGIGLTSPTNALSVSGTVWASKYSAYIRSGLPAPTSQTQSIVNALGDLSDVTISSVSNGNVLTYNGSAWVNSTPATTSPAGNNTEIQFNNSGSFGAASGFTWTNGSSLLNATNIASNNVTTADASADRILLNKASATCDASHDGTLRRNPTTGVLQICRH